MSLEVLILVTVSAVLGTDAARLTTGGLSQRQLSQTLANPTCPVGCVAGKCERDTTLGYVCTVCQSPLLTSAADGRCGCTAGKYSASELDCTPCDKGYYCPGGTFSIDAVTGNITGPPRIECGPGLTTVGRRSTALKACVNMPGTFYSVDSAGQPSSTPCAIDTYSTGNRKQRACVPCPPGHTTNGVTAAFTKATCLVKEGYFLKAGGFASPCPKGEYKAGLGPDEVCQKCPPGTSTLSMESTSAADCKVVLPGMYPSRMETENGTYILETQKCPQKYVCAGGVPTVAFTPTTSGPAPSVEGTTVQICPYGTFTEGLGATSFDQCLTPPGHRTVISGGTGYTEPCRNGEYRSAWKPAVAASSCTSCGDNIYSEPDDQITLFAITTDAKRSMLDVRASDAACYIKAGQGIYYSGSTKTYYAKNCEVDSYGASDTAYGLMASPCRDCPIGMVATTLYPSSAEFYVSDTSVSPARGGFTSPLACVTKPGFGYDGRIAIKCSVGSWNPPGTVDRCTKCDFGLSTPDDANSQVDESNCTLAPGFGWHEDAVVQCPIGTYNPELRADTTTPCTQCPTGYSTSYTGGTSLSSCDVCMPGHGDQHPNGKNCTMQCGGSTGPNYGPAGRDSDDLECTGCPANSGFTFDVMGKNQVYQPGLIARQGADSASDCISEFGQIQDATWFLGGNVSLTEVTAAAGINMTFDFCIQNCKADTNCQYVTYSYRTLQCFKKVAGTGSDIIAFKAVIGGVSADAESLSIAKALKEKRTKGFALSSGAYTFWRDNANGIGADTTGTGPTTSVHECLAACDMNDSCAAVVMTGVTDATSVPGSCVLVKGDVTPATFVRSMTKAVVNRLHLEDVL